LRKQNYVKTKKGKNQVYGEEEMREHEKYQFLQEVDLSIKF
jgi:hypothetical protein